MGPGSSTFLVFGLLLATASFAVAQQPAPHPPPARTSAPAALSVPHPLAALRPGPRDLYQAPDRSDRFQHLPLYPPRPVFVVPGAYVHGPYYLPVAGALDYPAAAPSVLPAQLAQGRLVLESLPDFAQVYVDGYYAGLVQEFGLRGRALDLSSGSHRVELRAPGYDILSFEVMIAPGEVLRYRGDMQKRPSTDQPRLVPTPAAQKSLYVIPNCYAGDKPPTKALPAGCDLKKLQTR